MPVENTKTKQVRFLRGVLVTLAAFIVGCFGAQPRTEGWVEVTTKHVRLRSMQDVETATRIATGLQRSRDALATSFLDCPTDPTRGRIEVTTLPEEEYELVGPRRSAGFYQNPGLSALTSSPGQIVVREELTFEARQVFQHEIVHRLVATCYPQAPSWLNEGLASFLETVEVGPSRLVVGVPTFRISPLATSANPVWARSATLMEVPIGWLPPTNALVNMNRGEFNAADENRFENLSHRAAAWALVHYLEIGAPDLSPRFDRYLGSLRAGARSPEEAWVREFGDVDVNGRVRAYLTEATQYVELAWKAPARATPVARPMTRAQGELHWAWLWSFHSAEDRAHAREHALRAMSDPTARAEAALIVALAELAEGKKAAARATVDRGLSESPRDAALLAFAVELRHALWRDHGAMSPDADELAARLLPIAALPEQHVVLSAHALIRNDAERALAHSQRAITIGPGCWRCWVARALATSAAERWPEALAALDRAMNLLPHGDRSGAAQLARVRKGILVRARERGTLLD